LGSYTAQAELGDYNEFDYGTTHHYLKELRFAPVQDDELLQRIYEQHQRHKYITISNIYQTITCLFISRGQPPNVADLNFVENAKKLAMYGVDLHQAHVLQFVWFLMIGTYLDMNSFE
jgi:band 4.1-like protein 1/2/3